MRRNFTHIDQSPNQERHEEATEKWEALRPQIVELYVNQGLTQTATAKRLGVTQQRLSAWMKRMGIGRG